MTQDPNTTESSPARPEDARRDLVLPVLLAVAIMVAVWWYWRVSVVDVGVQATQPSPDRAAPEERAKRTG